MSKKNNSNDTNFDMHSTVASIPMKDVSFMNYSKRGVIDPAIFTLQPVTYSSLENSLGDLTVRDPVLQDLNYYKNKLKKVNVSMVSKFSKKQGSGNYKMEIP